MAAFRGLRSDQARTERLAFTAPMKTAVRKVGRPVHKPLRTGPSHVSRLGTGGSTRLKRTIAARRRWRSALAGIGCMMDDVL